MNHALDNALNLAQLLSNLDDAPDELYLSMRQSFTAALDVSRSLETREPEQAIEWVLAHLPQDINETVRVSVNGPNLDPTVHPFAKAQGRSRWIWETQRERLQAAASVLRTSKIDITPSEVANMADSTREMLRASMRIEANAEPVKFTELEAEVSTSNPTNKKARNALIDSKLLTPEGNGPQRKYRVTERGVVVAEYLKSTLWGKY